MYYPKNDFRNYICHSDDELMHYGILGMKWGVRKDKSKPGFFEARRLKREAKKQEKMKQLAERQSRNKRISALSNVLDEFDLGYPGGFDAYSYGFAVRDAYERRHGYIHTLDIGSKSPDLYYQTVWEKTIDSPEKIKKGFAQIAKADGMIVTENGKDEDGISQYIAYYAKSK